MLAVPQDFFIALRSACVLNSELTNDMLALFSALLHGELKCGCSCSGLRTSPFAEVSNHVLDSPFTTQIDDPALEIFALVL